MEKNNIMIRLEKKEEYQKVSVNGKEYLLVQGGLGNPTLRRICQNKGTQM